MSLQIWAELGDPVGSFKGCKKRNGSGSPKIKVARSPIDLIFDVESEKDGPEAPKFDVNRFYPKTQLSCTSWARHSHCDSADPLTDWLEVCCVFYRPLWCTLVAVVEL